MDAADTEPFVQTTRSNSTTELSREINLNVLHPENPIMVRFQETLQKSLTTRLDQLNSEILEKKISLKKIHKSIEDLSQIVYVEKNENRKLETQLYDANISLCDVIDSKKNLLEDLKRMKNTRLSRDDILRNIKNTNQELSRKLRVEKSLMEKLKEFESQQLSNLKIKQIINEHNSLEKKLKLKEKNKNDYIMMRIENEVFKNQLLIEEQQKCVEEMSRELASLCNQIEMKKCDLEESLEENRHLINVWKNVVLLVSKRDEKCSIMRQKLETLEIKHKSLISELKSYKRSANEEMVENERITREKNNKRQYSNKIAQNVCELQKKDRLLNVEITNVQDMIKTTNSTLKSVKKMQQERKHKLSVVEVTLTQVNVRKNNLKEQILTKLHNNMISNKASTSLHDEIRTVRKEINKCSIIVEEQQSTYNKKRIILETKKREYELNLELKKNLNNDIASINSKYLKKNESLRKLKLKMKSLNHTFETTKKEVASLEKQPIRDNNLLKKFDIAKEKCQTIDVNIENEKIIWIRKQNEITVIMEQKNKLVFKLNTYQEHVFTMRQKISKLTQKVNSKETEKKTLEKSISFLLKQIFKLNNQYANQKDNYFSLDSKTCDVQNNVMEKLKICEDHAIKSLQNLEQISNKKEELEKTLTEVQKKYLEWEKKVKLIQDTRNYVEKEQSELGEIGCMKNEIHKMAIRYAQLKKAQSNLSNDLEMTVLKRDRILESVITKDKNQNVKHNLNTILRNTNTLNCKNKKLQKSLDEYDSTYNNLCFNKNKLMEKLSIFETNIDAVQNSIKILDEKIFEFRKAKQKKLEIIVQCQKLADFFYNVKNNKNITQQCHAEISVERNYQKYRCMQADLISVLHVLKEQYPDFEIGWLKNLNILQSL